MFKPVKPQVDFPKLEEEVLTYWKKNKIFEKTLVKKAPKGEWTFLDGPPFVTGLPHYGNLLSSFPKDVFGRYWTMKGYSVRRVWGWDGHGLPIENKVEGELGIKSKKEVESKVGIKKFIERCLYYVNQVSDEWEWYVDHIGRWVDFKHAYKTWDLSYMETVMWVFKQMYEKGFIYKGLRVLLYCPHCATPISNFEVAMDADNYKMKPDPSTVYKYQLKDQPDTYLLAWSTTPWNKIVTPALAVNPKLTYVKVKQGNEFYILAKATLHILNRQMSSRAKDERGDPVGIASSRHGGTRNDNMDNYKIVKEFNGRELIGKSFVPHYDYYPIEKGKRAFVVIPGDFVTADEGTGIVTMAAYGFEDLAAMQANNIHVEMHLDEEGTIKPNVPLFAGLYYLAANRAVNEDLAKRGLIYKNEEVIHSVPSCWRCGTRLYQSPQTAWYVNVQKLKYQLKKTNEPVNWFPKHFKYGRFLKSLESAPDWNISRNRYWGSPVPVWECACGERFVPGSIKELEERSGRKINNLHKPEIDEIVITCEKCSKAVKRVPEVLDSWIEAGSASFAERHYPFNKSEKREYFFPPDFITEYTGQIRAWFYVLHVISNALYDSGAFKNVLVTGVILGTDGRKMSKNYGNYPDPKELLQKYGGDALRLYLLGSPVMHGEDIIISEEQYRLQVRGMMLILWNVYNFFVTYADVDSWNPQSQKSHSTGSEQAKAKSQNVLDRWILSLLHRLIQDTTDSLENYDTVSSIDNLQKFIDNLSTWYIRRSRDRVGPSAANKQDKEAFYHTCFEVLTTLCKVIAPITPFLAEEIYRNLTGEESVHLTDWPLVNVELIHNQVLLDMVNVRGIVERGHAIRKEKGIKVRQPLQTIWLCGFKSVEKKRWENYEDLIKDELNVKQIDYTFYEKIKNNPQIIEFAEGKFIDITITPKLRAEGEAREIIRAIQVKRKEVGVRLDQYVIVTLPSWPKEHEEWIKKKTLARELNVGKELSVSL